jgi:hypothetical protein
MFIIINILNFLTTSAKKAPCSFQLPHGIPNKRGNLLRDFTPSPSKLITISGLLLLSLSMILRLFARMRNDQIKK